MAKTAQQTPNWGSGANNVVAPLAQPEFTAGRKAVPAWVVANENTAPMTESFLVESAALFPRMQGKPMAENSADLKIAASEARTETKIARLEGKIDVLGERVIGKIDALAGNLADADKYNRDTRLVLIGVLLAGFFAVGALIVSMATYGDALFGRGMNVRDVIQSTIKDYEAQKKALETPAATKGK